MLHTEFSACYQIMFLYIRFCECTQVHWCFATYVYKSCEFPTVYSASLDSHKPGLVDYHESSVSARVYIANTDDVHDQ